MNAASHILRLTLAAALAALCAGCLPGKPEGGATADGPRKGRAFHFARRPNYIVPAGSKATVTCELLVFELRRKSAPVAPAPSRSPAENADGEDVERLIADPEAVFAVDEYLLLGLDATNSLGNPDPGETNRSRGLGLRIAPSLMEDGQLRASLAIRYAWPDGSRVIAANTNLQGLPGKWRMISGAGSRTESRAPGGRLVGSEETTCYIAVRFGPIGKPPFAE